MLPPFAGTPREEATRDSKCSFKCGEESEKDPAPRFNNWNLKMMIFQSRNLGISWNLPFQGPILELPTISKCPRERAAQVASLKSDITALFGGSAPTCWFLLVILLHFIWSLDWNPIFFYQVVSSFRWSSLACLGIFGDSGGILTEQKQAGVARMM